MSTAQQFGQLADVVEALVGDHKARINRLESLRNHIALNETSFLAKIAAVRRAADDLERAFKEVIEDLISLNEAELEETAGSREPVPEAHLALPGSKANGGTH